ncbi:Dephospho-CoA kinase [Sedimentisphaera cyanobacteriorum]|uniref:Dephospho-CoA kinase n=1 Tax=Sedimentisphaera cyanobacteriorum TaxID=1940790 RepID=A0A1Q2HLA9_9BACT|nr:dephospho-CoA kinase [Sedimentisphaera cyanobacteriorum]AQQ08248.1 Dephospho-CoA kinase [Sedimentisphaera cyanobacteriorum]
MNFSEESQKPVIGLLGGIGSGKSYAAQIFSRLGCVVINADEIVAQLYKDSERLKQEIEKNFGSDAVCEGEINRKYLAQQVFADDEKLGKLNSITHRAVLEEIENKKRKLKDSASCRAIVYDVPLLLEKGLEKDCDYLIYIEASKAVRQKRVKHRSGLSEKELEIREKNQILLDKKKNIANYRIVNNSLGEEKLVPQIEQILTEILSGKK